MIVTKPFTTTSGDYMKCLLALWLPRYGWWLPVMLALFAGIGISLGDVRYLIIALMIVFIVCPMVMSIFYIYYMLTPEARRAVLRKQVEIIENQQMTLTYLPADEDDNRRLPQPETIPWSEIKTILRIGTFRVYILRSPRLSFILIPYSMLKLKK
ncbi:MAG: hypothetical protein OSJ46_02340 [Duncaniella sp.]|nr:hypothetical protein [Duncaniella sp.]